MVWRYACGFYRILNIFFPIVHTFNLGFFHASILWKCICKWHLVSATPPTVLDRSFWNFKCFNHSLKLSCAFYRILKLFSFAFFHIFNLIFFFLHGSKFVVGTLWAQLLLQFYIDPSETSQYLNHGLKICMCFLQNLEIFFFFFFFFFLIFHIFNVHFFSCFNTMKMYMQ